MRTARNWIIWYFVLMLLSQQWHFVLYYMGIDARTHSKVIIFLAIFCLLVGVIKYCRYLPRVQSAGLHRLKAGLFLASAGLLTSYGIVRGNLAFHAVMEAAGYGLILLFLVIGRYDQVWEDLERPLIVLFWVAFVIVVIGLFFPVKVTTESLSFMETSYNPRQKTIGYIQQLTLALWPLLFSLAYLRPKFDRWKLLGMGTLLAYMFLSVYFEKRAPMARSLVYAASILVIVPLLQKKLRIGTAMVLLFLIGTVFVAITVASATRFEALLQRYQEKDVINYTGSSRMYEAKSMLAELEPVEWVFGRGLGGYYTSVKWSTGNSVVDAEGNSGRLSCHIGVVVPILKGGLLFLLVFFAMYLPMLLPKKRGWYGNRYNMAVMAVVPVYLMFQFVESSPTFMVYMDNALVGLMWARLGRTVQPDYAAQDLEYYEVHEPDYSHTAFAPEPGCAQDSMAPRIW